LVETPLDEGSREVTVLAAATTEFERISLIGAGIAFCVYQAHEWFRKRHARDHPHD
jgi:hypothetical protein